MTEISDDVGQALLKIAEEVLGITGVSLDDDFLRLGGSSIMAFRFAVRIETTFGVDCPQRVIFDSESLAELTQFILKSQQSALSDEANPASGESGNAVA